MPRTQDIPSDKFFTKLMDYLLMITIGALKVILPLYDAICYLPYTIMNKKPENYLKSQEYKALPIDKKKSKESASYRSVNNMGSLTMSPFPAECQTLDQLFEYGVKRHAQRPYLGTRRCYREIEQKQANGKIFQKQILGTYEWLTFEEVNDRVTHFGRGLRSLGVGTHDKVLIFAETRAEWLITAQTAFRFNFCVVTLYATLGEEGIRHAINETQVKYIVTTTDLIQHFKDVSSMPSIKHIIYIEHSYKASMNFSEYPKQLKLHSFGDIVETGIEMNEVDVNKPTRDDLAVLLYTSGSTGPPKGVMISHGNLMSGMSGQIERITNLGYKDIYIGYLPLAHVLELACEISCGGLGVSIGYSTAHTLTDQSTKIIKGCKGDASELRPTLMAAVPAIMDRMYKVVWSKLNDSSAFQREIFKLFYEYKIKHRANGLSTPLVDRFIFQKIRNILGGRVRLMLSGGAPLSRETQRFMNVCFCCPVGQGYGLTETCGAGTVQESNDLSFGRVGSPLFCNQVKLVDWDEGNYTSRDLPYPRGEIVFGGHNVAMGYFRRDEETKRDFYTDENGLRWFRSGDIGQWHDDGALEIIDRKKDLVKLQLGEYVALSKIETALKLCPLVENCCVVANSLNNYVVCIIVPNDRNLVSLSARYTNVISFKTAMDDIDNNELLELCNNEQIAKAVLHQIQEYGKSSKLTSYEIPQRICLTLEPWTPESGLVTSTNKIKRRQIALHYAQEIEKMYM